ncbi:MAG TPA: hypothetical protein ENJ77_01275 [Candidatus Moranbacteria bacterium]|nr:hypothetical protein [Candidatus Moranbacteria bacterium]
MKEISWEKLAEADLRGKVFLLPTDTVWGLHALCGDRAAEEKLRRLKGRDGTKPFIVLIADPRDLNDFGVVLDERMRELIDLIWPGPRTLILPAAGGGKTAFRRPAFAPLADFLRRRGAVFSTSANLGGEPTIAEPAELPSVLAEEVDYFVPGERKTSQPSLLLDILR